MRAGLDGVSGLFQELAGIADALVDRFGPDAEQGSDGGLRQGMALVKDGGQEPVGEGEDGAAVGAGGRQPRAVAAAPIQARFPLLVMQRHQRVDQGTYRKDGAERGGQFGVAGRYSTFQASAQ